MKNPSLTNDNRDRDEMYKFYEARIEALQRAVRQLQEENAALKAEREEQVA